jgi:hypothetical protein
MRLARVVTLGAVALVLAAACGGGPSANQTPDSGIRACGTEPLPPCPAFGQPVSLEVVPSQLPDFPPLPNARAAAFPGERVNVTLEGFRPGEQAQIFSTDDTYNLLRYPADSDGTIQFPVDIPSSAEAGEDYFIVIQEPGDDGEPILGSFIIVTLDRESAKDPQTDVLGDALDSVGWGDAVP